MITGSQIRAARAMLRWTAPELARHSGVSVPTIRRLERVDTPRGQSASVALIEAAFQQAGINFVGRPGHGPGLRHWNG